MWSSFKIVIVKLLVNFSLLTLVPQKTPKNNGQFRIWSETRPVVLFPAIFGPLVPLRALHTHMPPGHHRARAHIPSPRRRRPWRRRKKQGREGGQTRRRRLAGRGARAHTVALHLFPNSVGSLPLARSPFCTTR